MKQEERNCIQCGKKIVGRIDKKFCDDYCRNTYNNQQNSDATNFIRNVNNALRRNRRILEGVIPEEEEIRKVQRTRLVQEGFDFKYFTHIYTNQKGQQYFFVYDHGYLDLGGDVLLIVKRREP